MSEVYAIFVWRLHHVRTISLCAVKQSPHALLSSSQSWACKGARACIFEVVQGLEKWIWEGTALILVRFGSAGSLWRFSKIFPDM